MIHSLDLIYGFILRILVALHQVISFQVFNLIKTSVHAYIRCEHYTFLSILIESHIKFPGDISEGPLTLLMDIFSVYQTVETRGFELNKKTIFGE